MKKKFNNRISIILFSKDSELFARIQTIIAGFAELQIVEQFEEDLNPDISLIDVDTAGISLLSKLKDRSFVIILTREKGSRYMIESMTFGAYDCLSLPINKEVFMDSISKSVRSEEELNGELTNYSKVVEGQGVACATAG